MNLRLRQKIRHSVALGKIKIALINFQDKNCDNMSRKNSPYAKEIKLNADLCRYL